MDKDIYMLVSEKGHLMSKQELLDLLKETALKLWDVLDNNNQGYIKACSEILETLKDNE